MSKKEISRLEVIHKVMDKRLTQIEAGEILRLTDRQVRRIVRKVKKDGDIGIIHKSRGKPSKRKLSKQYIKEILKIYEDNYFDFHPTHANEKLSEKHGIKISTETLRKILINHDKWIPRRQKDKDNIHIWRERKAHKGEMTQIDGSHHRWLEDRLDQEFCLMGYIDDATNEIYAKFYEYEGIFPILDSFQEYIQENGIPLSVYVDKHSTYKINRQASVDEELRDEQAKTQFERIMKNIGVQVIHAHSAQAKGRVEKLFRTLQNRLVKEMRLAGIKSIKEANVFLKSYLPKFNKKFAKEAKSKHSLFKSVSKDFDYKWTFSIQDKRIIANDYTIRWKNRLFLIANPSLTLKKRSVMISQSLSGDLKFSTSTTELTVKEITHKDLDLAKKADKELLNFLKSSVHRKSKKSWMDGFYIGAPTVALKK